MSNNHALSKRVENRLPVFAKATRRLMEQLNIEERPNADRPQEILIELDDSLDSGSAQFRRKGILYEGPCVAGWLAPRIALNSESATNILTEPKNGLRKEDLF